MLEHEFVQLLTNTPSLEVKVILKGKLNTALLRTPKLGLSFSATTDPINCLASIFLTVNSGSYFETTCNMMKRVWLYNIWVAKD